MDSVRQVVDVSGGAATGFSPPRETLLTAVEEGKVLYFQRFPFSLEAGEQHLLDLSLADPKRKNISLDPESGVLHGVVGDAGTQDAVKAMIRRYHDAAGSLVDTLFPEYRGRLRKAPTSLRLHRVEGRQTSWRKDDSRLHVDAFPSRPNYGERILRVFMNVNPAGEPRVWRVGESFETVARQFLPKIPRQWPGSARLLHALKITKRRRSPYDHIMLNLHDAMKGDPGYQQGCAQERVEFAPGGGWICFSDQASHAAMGGQFMLEQTFFLPVDSMADQTRSPLAILQRLTGRALIYKRAVYALVIALLALTIEAC
ncbi:Kdo hydroxylase family protein [Jeongeupia naejangsanensis]|uniref:Kdo hydroxylase family protein n=1 Tax=Jeongeupia naejangsanensis TaxID=613195 RepID=A0ABS2BI54_9NEIS|nr:Kdo hydroxylase family protein [Jeongeupia naejangsanensis]MBM3114636.1 Kdo hydroxylase family protein [Jeongeupia naejangsanensis]